jgi:hypothetical protein
MCAAGAFPREISQRLSQNLSREPCRKLFELVRRRPEEMAPAIRRFWDDFADKCVAPIMLTTVHASDPGEASCQSPKWYA